ncbi:lantibiotic dehydratase C-terminal domain-containing protein [Herbidospora yilanensis]|uniref:lantibiotic dehydratase C-terminal domain-containing protein n=1 Tax=Herbidospora yilanensis TaxID=354426 RepID=UPI0007850C16|nr:lantibiotic dehydratase C-terminal domain-containing protein [Herbidospora yilanensis]
MPDGWISLHVFHRSDTDLLLTTAVHRLVGELELGGYFFLRYWEGGPHLRLRLLPRIPGDAAAIEKHATAALEKHLAAHPTTGPWDRERYTLLAGEWARREGLAAYDRRLRPDDHVEAIPYRPEYVTFGGPEAVAAVERHFADSSRIALAVLRGEPDRRRRLGHAFTALTLTRLAAPDLRRRDRLPASARQAALFVSQREALTAQAERCRHIAEGADDDGPPGVWWRSIDALRRAGVRADVLDRCAHLFCNRLGLSIAEEAHVRYLTAATREGTG